MNWIMTLKSSGHITEAVYHFNQAMGGLETGWSMVEVSRSFFDALNKIQTEWRLYESDQEMGEIKAFRSMIMKGLNEESTTNFLQSTELSNFVFFEPQIMNHKILQRHRYRPDQEIEQQLAKKASDEHNKVVNAYNAYLSPQNDEEKERVIKRVAELMYVVRSNIAHGEKTPYGPDLKKKERDEKICKVIIPLQQLLLNLLFDYPDRKLVAYGTLAPGKVNHVLLSDIQGTWEDCSLRGYFNEINELTFFNWQTSGKEIKAQLFSSDFLPNILDRIDSFEGANYRRILVPIERNQGIAVANVYVSKQNQETMKWQH
jgi:gamma-glutamylcyclotransferase (GGCT)/AIG2-like uncharacterized protein YtfP